MEFETVFCQQCGHPKFFLLIEKKEVVIICAHCGIPSKIGDLQEEMPKQDSGAQ